MGNRSILSSKSPEQDSFVSVDMTPLLSAGEGVTSAVVTASTLIGDDPVAAIVSGAATVLRNVVTQKIIDGLAGNTYCLRCAATTNQGNILITLANLTVVSSNSYD